MKKGTNKSVKILYPYCGLDEAGRGALAGPLVSAAIVLTRDAETMIRRSGLKVQDSKLLSARDRQLIYEYLKTIPVITKTVTISSRQINNRGIGFANKESFRILIREMPAELYIVDGNIRVGRIKNKTRKILPVVNADATILAAILAGIVAKVERDSIMKNLHTSYPQYHWNNNVGYGTPRHLAALRTFGHTRYHRNIFITTALKKFI